MDISGDLHVFKSWKKKIKNRQFFTRPVFLSTRVSSKSTEIQVTLMQGVFFSSLIFQMYIYILSLGEWNGLKNKINHLLDTTGRHLY